MPFSHLFLCCPLFLLPPIPPSIRVFSNESTVRRRWPKYWSFSFSISPSKEHQGLISFRMDWLDFLSVHCPLMNTSKTLFNLIQSLSFLESPTDSFSVSISLLILPIHYWFHVSIRAFIILVIVSLNSLSDNFNICVISKSGCDTCSVSSFFFFLVFWPAI